MAGKAKPNSAKTSPEGERIAKVLSRAGVASRREAERMIEMGEVAVNGAVITSPALNVTPKDKITVRGVQVAEPEPPRLWLYYKPEGLVTSASDEKGRQTVFDNLPEDLPRVMSVGRLDLNSEGLLLLTNDGEMKRRLELPSTGWLRKYRVRVNGNPTDPDLEPLRKGITVDGERFLPMTVVLDRIQGANAWLTVSLREGRNREIRRAMSAVELTVNRLIRVSYGPFRLGELMPGQVEEVRAKVLRDQLGEGAATGEDGEDKPARKPARTSAERKGPSAPKAGPPRARPGDGLKQLSEVWKEAVMPREAESEKASADKVAARRIFAGQLVAGKVTTTGRSDDKPSGRRPSKPDSENPYRNFGVPVREGASKTPIKSGAKPSTKPAAPGKLKAAHGRGVELDAPTSRKAYGPRKDSRGGKGSPPPRSVGGAETGTGSKPNAASKPTGGARPSAPSKRPGGPSKPGPKRGG